MVVTKIDPRVYTYYLSADKNDPEYTSCLWAQFVFDCSTGLLNINSDAGDYSYRWGYNEHEDFMHLMSRIHKDYFRSNRILSSGKYPGNSKVNRIERI